MNKPLLSLCIPTNGVSHWVIPVLNNIYSLGTDNSIFEIVVADNGGTSSDLEIPIQEFSKYSNFYYYKTESKGFYNIIENFVLSHGDFMIKLNHRCMLNKGMIEQIYEMGLKYLSEKPLIYFSNNKLGKKKIMEYASFDEFLYNLSYRSSMSQGLFFWKEDLDNIPKITFAKMSPNVSLMFDSKTKNKFVIDDRPICYELDQTGKYGYDLFDTFAVLYLDLVNQVRIDGFVSKKTFSKIKRDILQSLTLVYAAMKCDGDFENYSLEGMLDSLCVYYSKSDYYKMILYTNLVYRPKAIVKKILRVSGFR